MNFKKESFPVSKRKGQENKLDLFFFSIITFKLLIYLGLFGTEKGLFASKISLQKGLEWENTLNQNGFPTSPGLLPPPHFPPAPLTKYVRLSLPLPCAFPSHIKTFRPRAMWIISQFSSWAVHQEQTQTSRPDQNTLLVLDRRLLHLGDLMHPLSAQGISCVRSFSACRLWSHKFPYPAANLIITEAQAAGWERHNPLLHGCMLCKLKQSLEGLTTDLSALTAVVPRPPGAWN